MSSILAIEAATTDCSVALLHRGELLERSHNVPREHARYLLPYIDELLAEAGCVLADLDALAVGRGPGSFTGVRAAIATVQGLAFGSGLPVVMASTLAVLAATAQRIHGCARNLVLLDARMDEIYCAAYQGQDIVLPEQLLRPELLEVPAAWLDAGNWHAAGSGLVYTGRLPDEITCHATEQGGQLAPLAADLARLAIPALAAGQAITDPGLVQPVYLRDQVVHTAPSKTII